MKIQQILKVAIRGGASDVLLKVGSVPRFRHNGQLVSLSDGEVITDGKIGEWLKEIVPVTLQNRIGSANELDFAFHMESGARFRVNLFRQQGHYGLVMRVIPNHVRTLQELKLPPIFHEICNFKQGLVLVTGATGSGKSTTLAAAIQSINLQRNVHIITIEDPVESIFVDQKATINQREVGLDTDGFAMALRAALRQNPDIILVGELRDKETIETTLMAAETGHLVFSTLHTHDAVDSLNRIMSYFEPYQHSMIRSQLATTLRVVISQRLVPKLDGKSMIPAMEIMVVNQLIREAIVAGSSFEVIHDAIRKGGDNYGMQSFDRSLLDLFNKGIISAEQALKFASSPSNMKRALDGVGDNL